METRIIVAVIFITLTILYLNPDRIRKRLRKIESLDEADFKDKEAFKKRKVNSLKMLELRAGISRSVARSFLIRKLRRLGFFRGYRSGMRELDQQIWETRMQAETS